MWMTAVVLSPLPENVITSLCGGEVRKDFFLPFRLCRYIDGGYEEKIVRNDKHSFTYQRGGREVERKVRKRPSLQHVQARTLIVCLCLGGRPCIWAMGSFPSKKRQSAAAQLMLDPPSKSQTTPFSLFPSFSTSLVTSLLSRVKG